ncbi:MAG: NfeD family protein [candidate division Zixibacteria bacterium]
MDRVIWVWLAAALAFIIFEIFAPSFIFACFVVGAIAGGITALFTDSYVLQGAVFAVVSLILLPLTRPLANKITKESPIKSNMDAYVGQTAMVKKEVSDIAGQVVIDGQIWQARAEKTIPADARVKVISYEGAKLNVEKAE